LLAGRGGREEERAAVGWMREGRSRVLHARELHWNEQP
jgi:hypothetical protein